jgi:hypothetical protein
MTDETTAAHGDISLRGRLAKRRAELRGEHSFDIPVPGYEEELVARYHTLDYHVLRRIGKRNEDEADPVQSELNVAADTLANACSGLFEVGEDGTLTDTGHRWSTAAAKDLFGIGEDELPAGSTARDAMFRIFQNDTAVVMHFSRYSDLSTNAGARVDKELRGESEAGSEPA